MIEERSYWNENKSKINYNYPLDRAINLRAKILTLDENKKVNQIIKAIQFITQIGNVVALARCIRTALMDYNSQNVNLLTTYNTNDFNNLIEKVSLQVSDNPSSQSSQLSPNMITNTQNALIESSQLFSKTISAFKQIGENELNYFEVLITGFRGSINLEKMPFIELFAFLLPPLTITFIENAINARENLLKKNKSEDAQHFSDDGFIMGMCYLLKLFLSDKKFESLNWFTSVIDFYDNKKSGKKSDKKTKVEVLAEREGESYKEQFELQFFIYTSASILFTD